MSTIYVHIGSEKCGSSLIEYVLLHHKDTHILLARSGITALSQFQSALRKVVPGTTWDEGVHGRLRAQLLAPLLKPSSKMFTSEEHLLSLSHEPGRPNPYDRTIDFTRRMFRGFDVVKPILIVRRQDRFIESHYNQCVRRGETREFAAAFDSLPLENYCWDQIADVWSDAFGEGNLTVFPLETSVLSTAAGGPKNTPSAICRLMGAPIEFRNEDLPMVNPSLRTDLLAAQREINRTFDIETSNRVADILSRETERVPGPVQGLFSREERQKVLDRYAASNRRLFEKYLPQYSVDEYIAV